MALNILIIGATSAVAQAVAARWAHDGENMYWLARDRARLEQQVASFGGSVKGWQCLDFLDYEKVEVAVEQAHEVLGSIDIALIAHGFLPAQLETEKDIALVQKTLDSNLTSAVAFILPLSRLMQQQGRGKIGVASSVAGDRGRPRNFTYAAAKGGLTIYLQGLRSVLWQSGVEIYTFRLGPVDTPMTASHDKNFSFAGVDQVAAAITSAFRKRRYDVYIPGFWRWVMLLVRNMPEWLFQRLTFLSGR